jgi:hypothetical protein
MALVFGILGLAAAAVLPDELGAGQEPLCFAIGGMLAAGLCWVWGSLLEGRLWFVPLKYYSIPYLLVFGWEAVQLTQEASLSGAHQQPATTSDSVSQSSIAVPQPVVTAVQPAPTTGPKKLSWQLYDDVDKLTDVVTRKALSKTQLAGGTTVEASAVCDELGIEIALNTFRGDQAVPFAWEDNKIRIRLRIDDGETRSAGADEQYTNEVTIEFYDPTAARRLSQGAIAAATPHLPSGESKAQQGASELANGLMGFFGGIAATSALAQLDVDAGGKLDQLVNAGSIRVELPLADGSSHVIELNPQDRALSTIVAKCKEREDQQSARESQEGTAKQAAMEAEKARGNFEESQRSIRINADYVANGGWVKSNSGDKAGNNFCKAGQFMHTVYHDRAYANSNRDADRVPALPSDAAYYLDPRHKWVPGGTKIQILGPGLPQNGGLLPFCRVRNLASGEALMINVQYLVPN